MQRVRGSSRPRPETAVIEVVSINVPKGLGIVLDDGGQGNCSDLLATRSAERSVLNRLPLDAEEVSSNTDR